MTLFVFGDSGGFKYCRKNTACLKSDIPRPSMQTTDVDNLFRAEADIQGAQARQLKAERNQDIGEPIDLESKIISLLVRGQDAWTAESSKVVRRVDLQTGKTLQVYKGHTGPVTSLAFLDTRNPDGSTQTYLITGSWDKTIKIWDITTKAIISDTPAHDDFLKTLLVIPSSKILASSSSDKLIKLWDLERLGEGDVGPLHQLASISGHRRPVEALATSSHNPKHLISGDSMGVMKAWTLEARWQASANSLPTVCATPTADIGGHRTGVNDIALTSSHLWTASTDETVTVRTYPPTTTSDAPSSITTLEHSHPVKCLLLLSESFIKQPYLLTGNGDVIRVYDISELIDENEDSGDHGSQKPLQEVSGTARLLNEVDVHAHSVTSLQLWVKTSDDGAKSEPWIVSGSLDGTIRRWRLSELVAGRRFTPPEPTQKAPDSMLTEEEERELAELMDDD